MIPPAALLIEPGWAGNRIPNPEKASVQLGGRLVPIKMERVEWNPLTIE